MRLPIALLLRSRLFWFFVSKVVIAIAVGIARELNDRPAQEDS